LSQTIALSAAKKDPNKYSTFACFEYSAENRNEINGTAYNIYNKLRHVNLGFRTDVLLHRDMNDLEGTNTPGNSILNFRGRFS